MNKEDILIFPPLALPSSSYKGHPALPEFSAWLLPSSPSYYLNIKTKPPASAGLRQPVLKAPVNQAGSAGFKQVPGDKRGHAQAESRPRGQVHNGFKPERAEKEYDESGQDEKAEQARIAGFAKRLQCPYQESRGRETQQVAAGRAENRGKPAGRTGEDRRPGRAEHYIEKLGGSAGTGAEISPGQQDEESLQRHRYRRKGERNPHEGPHDS